MAGFPSRTASFPTRRMAERWGKTTEAEMIEGRHFRSVEARRRTLGEAINRYLEHEMPKLRNGSMHRTALPWWREKLGHLKLCNITPALIVEHRDKLAAGSYVRARPGAKGSTLKADEKPRAFRRKPNWCCRCLLLWPTAARQRTASQLPRTAAHRILRAALRTAQADPHQERAACQGAGRIQCDDERQLKTFEAAIEYHNKQFLAPVPPVAHAVH